MKKEVTGKKKSIIKCIILVIIFIFLICFLILAILFRNEIRTLGTIKQVDDYPFLTMTYKGDYYFDEFLKQGAKDDKELIQFIMKHLLKGIELKVDITLPGCMTMYAENAEGENIVGRNFDFTYSPSLLVKTKPENGYESISIANLANLGFNKENKLKIHSLKSVFTLAAPYIPMDGMNECGLVVSIMAIPEPMPVKTTNKVMLNTTTVVRLLLDKAANVNDAIELLKQYDVHFSGNLNCHYLIGDATGKSVVLEWVNGEMQVVEPVEDFQVCTNFILYKDLNIGRGQERFQIAHEYLQNKKGILSEEEAMDLLRKTDTDANPPKKLEKGKELSQTQWSVVYNTEKKDIDIVIHKKFNKIYHYDFDSLH